jgi:hypothetical protein
MELSESRWAYDTERLIEQLAQTADLEPAPANGKVPPDSGLRLSGVMRIAARLPGDFLSLLSNPVRFLIERGLAERGALFRSCLFVFTSQLIAGLLVLQEWPTQSPTAQFLLTSVILVFLAALILSLPLYGAWRLLGAPREYQRVVVILFYQASFVGLGISLSILLTLIGLNLASPATVVALTRSPTLDGLLTLSKALESMPPSAAPVVAAVASFLVLVGLLVWLLVTWRAYQVVLHQTTRRSWAALVLFALACLSPIGLLAWVALVMESA